MHRQSAVLMQRCGWLRLVWCYCLQKRLDHAARIHSHVAKVRNKRDVEREAALQNLRHVLRNKAKDARPRWLRMYDASMETPACQRLIAGLSNALKVVVGHINEKSDRLTRVPADISELRQACNPQITRTGHVFVPEPRGGGPEAAAAHTFGLA